MTANFIAFYMEYLINLFILLPHTSHLFQLLDVNIFALLKHTLTKKINAVFQFNSILAAFRVQIKFQYLFKLNHKF